MPRLRQRWILDIEHLLGMSYEINHLLSMYDRQRRKAQ
jgi:hypothetical protein